MSASTKPRVPAGSCAKAKAMWVSIVGAYDLRADELRVLEDACREVDLIERIEAELRAKGAKLVVAGSMGQPVSSPLIQEVRQHRATLARLLAQLKLPEDPAVEASASADRSSQARARANARWRRGA